MASHDNLAVCIVKKLGQLWEAAEHSDIKIVIGDVHFNCHRFHLSACSEFFGVLLKTQTGKTSNDAMAVNIQGISPETLKIILFSVYTGELTVNLENMLKLWHASHHLQIDFLVDKLECFISRNITDQNFFDVYKLALELDSNSIQKSVQSFMARNFEELRKTDVFLNLSFNCFLEVLGHDDLDLKSYDDLVMSVLDWANYKPRPIEGTSRAQEGKSLDLKETKLKDKQQTPYTNNAKEKNAIAVIFKSLDDVPFKVESSSQRKNKLGELINIINLNDVSQDCLLAVLNNDNVMECREARTLVRQAFVDRKDKKHSVTQIKSKKSHSSADLFYTEEDVQFDKPKDLEDTAPVVVYIQAILGGILAYNLDTGKTCSVPQNGLPLDLLIQDIYSHKNQIYLTMTKSTYNDHPVRIFKMHSNGQWEFLIDGPIDGRSIMFNDKYIYCVVDYTNLCRLNIECLDSLVWVHVCDIPFNSSLFISGNKLLYEIIDTFTNGNLLKLNQTIKAKAIHYIDLKSLTIGQSNVWLSGEERILSQVESFDGDELFTPPSGVIMEHSHLLTDKGRLIHVTHPNDTSLKVTPEEILFAIEQRVFGAVRYKNILYLFKRSAEEICEPTNEKLTSFSEIRVVTLLNADSNCMPLVAPKQWMSREI